MWSRAQVQILHPLLELSLHCLAFAFLSGQPNHAVKASRSQRRMRVPTAAFYVSVCYCC